MRITALPLAVVLLAASCSAQISLGGKNIDFGVKRKRPPTATIVILNPATYSAGTTVSLQLKLSNFDESKGFHTYTQKPCHAGNATLISPGLYKLDLIIDDVDIDGVCQLSMNGLAANQGATIEVPYKNDQAQHQAKLAGASANLQSFANHKTWVAKTSSGSSYTLEVASVQDIPAQDGPGGKAAMLRDPKIPVPSMLVMMPPNQVQMTRMGCVMQGTFTGSIATLKPDASRPASTCPDGDITLQGK